MSFSSPFAGEGRFLKELGRECLGELVYRTINIFAKIIELSVSFQIASGPRQERWVFNVEISCARFGFFLFFFSFAKSHFMFRKDWFIGAFLAYLLCYAIPHQVQRHNHQFANLFSCSQKEVCLLEFKLIYLLCWMIFASPKAWTFSFPPFLLWN